MERSKNNRASRRCHITGIVYEVNQLVRSEQREVSTLHVLHSQLKAVNVVLAVLNAELAAFITKEQVAEDYDSAMEYEGTTTSILALLKHHMDRLRVSSPISTAQPRTTADGDPPATSDREPIRPQREFGAQLPTLELQRFDGSLTQCGRFGTCYGTLYT
ncbi:hypothetical protein HPB52_021989 [Rhipicephalus sanguineus]|uniref:Uncharacterized protein n=1 Tax=Rhipicephalus sanguineus TaxID=34632 RepID=A0A9D4T4I7_RHISA|nr:hypothetical protein HPB52_021989 [Rhipicephalus sanguineus]